MNIQLNYLYRDAANYKNWDWEIFSNNEGIALETISELIRSALIKGAWFYADKWGVKDLHFEKWDNEADHLWHEFDSIEETTDPVTRGDIAQFLSNISAFPVSL